MRTPTSPAIVLMLAALVLGSCSEPASAPTAAPSTPLSTPRVSALAALPTGPPPGIGYVDGDVHVAPDGTRTELPRRFGIGAVTPYRGGFLVADTRYFEGTNGLAVVEGVQREDLGPACTSGHGAVSPDGEALAWATFYCPESDMPPTPLLIHRRNPDGEVAQEIAVAPNSNSLTSVVGFLGDDLVYNRGYIEGAFRTDLESEPRRIPGLVRVVSLDEASGLVAGSLDRDGVRDGVVDPVSGDRLWQGRLLLGPFSPDGSVIVGQGRRTWSVLDAATGKERYALDVPERLSLQFEWEDDRHLLAVASTNREAAIVRFDDRGAIELVTPVVPVVPGEPDYVLEHQP